MDLTVYLHQKKKRIDDFLRKYAARKRTNRECPSTLGKALVYALMAGGKRVRPILCMASYDATGGRSSSILPVAASLELIHTYSLIHDDLPAMDNDDFRRNKPTTHRVFGEAIAILAGDALLTDAFRIITTARADSRILMKVINELTFASGPEGMVGGQAVDLICEGKTASKKELMYIHSHKTGRLIRSSVRIGAIMAGASPSQLRAFSVYGEKVGLAFQIVDDILDVTGTKKALGKTTGADSRKGKNTYPSIFGLEQSYTIAEGLINDSLKAITILKDKGKPLAEIAKYIISRHN